MTEQNDATQADAESQSQADTSTDRDSQAESHTETISLDEAKKLRSEAAGLRKRLKDAESKVRAAEDVGKSESEKREQALKSAEERATAAESRYQAAIGRAAVYEAVGSLASPRAIYALIRDDIEFDEDDNPTNITDLIDREKKADPSMFRAAAGSADGGRVNDTTKPEATPGFGRILQAYETTSKTARR